MAMLYKQYACIKKLIRTPDSRKMFSKFHQRLRNIEKLKSNLFNYGRPRFVSIFELEERVFCKKSNRILERPVKRSLCKKYSVSHRTM